MRRGGRVSGMVLVGALASCTAAGKSESSTDRREIGAVYKHYSAVVKSRNVDSIMAFYAPDESLVLFDAFTPLQYRGAAAYRKAYEGFFAAYPGPVTSEISDLHITMEGTLAVVSGIDRWVATSADGKPTEIVFRATNALRKIEGKWLFVHEHLSVPVDPATGQAVFLATP